MKIDLVRLWASPSTLHLRVVYGPDNGAWIRSKEVHMPWSVLSEGMKDTLRHALDEERDEDPQQLTLL